MQQADPEDIQNVLFLLGQTPERIVLMAQGLDGARLNARPGVEAWSASDILAHLRACADVWGGWIALMLARDHPTLRHVSPRSYIKKTNYLAQEFDDLLGAYTLQRAGLLHALRPLEPADWARGAAFTGTTRARAETVYSIARRIVSHELVHCEQLVQLLGPE